MVARQRGCRGVTQCDWCGLCLVQKLFDLCECVQGVCISVCLSLSPKAVGVSYVRNTRVD